MVCRIQSVKSSYCISHRIWDRMRFEDGEEIVTVCLWEPYVSSTSLFLEETGSTNQDIILGDYDKRHIYTGKQTEGRGRHKRKWESMEKAYAGSWDISENESMAPGIVQLAAALAVGENFFGLSADLDKLSQSIDDYFAAVENLKTTLKQQDKQIQSNLEAVKSMDAFRRQTNLKILDLEKKIQAQSVESSLKTQNIDSNTLSPE